METRLTRRALAGIAILGPWLGRAPAIPATPATPAPVAPTAVPTYRGNAERTGANPGPGPAGEPAALWQVRLGTAISGSPAVVDGVVYIGSLGPGTRDGGFLHAVDAATGVERWRLGTAPGDGFFTSPAVAAGVAVIGSYDGIILAADLATGTERWRFQAAEAFYASPALVDGVAYLGDRGGHLYALDAATGEARWQVVVGRGYERSFGTPAVSAGVVYAVDVSRWADEPSCVHAWDAASGAERWCFEIAPELVPRATPVVAGGRLHVLTRDETVLSIDLASGEEAGRLALPAPSATELAVVDGVGYVGTDDGQVHALDPGSGALRWSVALAPAGQLLTGPCVAGDTVYVGDRAGRIHAVDAATGAERWARRVGTLRSAPAVVGGVLYAGSHSGALRALGGSPA